MSDDLRGQLQSALWARIASPADEALDAIWHLVAAAVADARAATAEEIAFNLGSLDGKEAPHFYRNEAATAWERGYDAGVEAAAALARSVGSEELKP